MDLGNGWKGSPTVPHAFLRAKQGQMTSKRGALNNVVRVGRALLLLAHRFLAACVGEPEIGHRSHIEKYRYG
eukprot:scaffold398_cov356-Pavlova_lutheri.AAC.15